MKSSASSSSAELYSDSHILDECVADCKKKQGYLFKNKKKGKFAKESLPRNALNQKVAKKSSLGLKYYQEHVHKK